MLFRHDRLKANHEAHPFDQYSGRLRYSNQLPKLGGFYKLHSINSIQFLLYSA